MLMLIVSVNGVQLMRKKQLIHDPYVVLPLNTLCLLICQSRVKGANKEN